MTLHESLQRSHATGAFRDAIASFLRDGRSNELVRFDAYSPPVKVERTLTQLLQARPELEIERVEIRGSSGCEFFRGALMAVAAGEERCFRFHWDCKWKAIQQGWTDYFGFPDQARAAREFGYDCFRTWEEQEAGQPA